MYAGRMTRGGAQRAAALAQACGVAAGALSIGLLALWPRGGGGGFEPVSYEDAVVPVAIERAKPPARAEGDGDAEAPPDAELILESLLTIGRVKKPEPVPPPEEIAAAQAEQAAVWAAAAAAEAAEGGEDPGAVDAGDEVEEENWQGVARYLGRATFGQTAWAWIGVEERRHLVEAGTSRRFGVVDVRVLEAEAEYAVIEEDGRRRRVERAARSVSVAGPAAAADAALVGLTPKSELRAARPALGAARNTGAPAAAPIPGPTEVVDPTRPVDPKQFQRADGTFDQEGYRKASQEYNRQRAINRQGNFYSAPNNASSPEEYTTRPPPD